jgi:diguanylate cyclase (GGDEF)-like protein
LALDELLDKVARYAAVAVGCPLAYIYEYDQEHDALITRARYGPADKGRAEPIGFVDPLSNWPLDRRAIELGETVEQRVSDPELPEELRHRFQKWGEKASLVVPIRYRELTIGEFELIDTEQERRFSDEDRQLMAAFGEQVAIAIVAAQAREALAAQNRRLAALLAAGRALAGSLEYEQVLQQVVRQGRLGLGTSQCLLYEHDAETGQLALRARDDAPGSPAVHRVGHRRVPNLPGESDALQSDRIAVWHSGEIPASAASVCGVLADGQGSCLLVPLVHHGEVLGELFFVERAEDREFTKDEERLARGLGEQAVLSMVNARLHRRAEAQLALRHDLLKLSESLLSSLDDTAVFDRVAETLKSLVDFDSVSVGVVDEEKAEVHIIFAGGRDAEAVKDSRFPLGVGIISDVLQKGVPERVNDVLGDPRTYHVPGTPDEEQASILVPIQLGKQRAAIVVDRYGGDHFTEDDLETLRLFASLAAVALENARLYRAAEEQAMTDGLTGLYNHRYFYDRLAAEVARARRSRTPLALLMIDLDDFKQLNDDFGHQAGDEVLRTVSRLLRESTRSGVDLPARYGGEELAVILPNTAAEADGTGEQARGALAVAERLRQTIANAEMSYAAEMGITPLRVTVSIGVAVYPVTAGTMGELVAQADAALYLAKRRGKNRVAAYGLR